MKSFFKISVSRIQFLYEKQCTMLFINKLSFPSHINFPIQYLLSLFEGIDDMRHQENKTNNKENKGL